MDFISLINYNIENVCMCVFLIRLQRFYFFILLIDKKHTNLEMDKRNIAIE